MSGDVPAKGFVRFPAQRSNAEGYASRPSFRVRGQRAKSANTKSKLDRLDSERLDLTLDCASTGNLRETQVIDGLQVQPRMCITAEVARQTHGRIGGNPAAFAHDVIDARSRHYNA